MSDSGDSLSEQSGVSSRRLRRVYADPYSAALAGAKALAQQWRERTAQQLQQGAVRQAAAAPASARPAAVAPPTEPPSAAPTPPPDPPLLPPPPSAGVAGRRRDLSPPAPCGPLPREQLMLVRRPAPPEPAPPRSAVAALRSGISPTIPRRPPRSSGWQPLMSPRADTPASEPGAEAERQQQQPQGAPAEASSAGAGGAARRSTAVAELLVSSGHRRHVSPVRPSGPGRAASAAAPAAGEGTAPSQQGALEFYEDSVPSQHGGEQPPPPSVPPSAPPTAPPSEPPGRRGSRQSNSTAAGEPTTPNTPPEAAPAAPRSSHAGTVECGGGRSAPRVVDVPMDEDDEAEAERRASAPLRPAAALPPAGDPAFLAAVAERYVVRYGPPPASEQDASPAPRRPLEQQQQQQQRWEPGPVQPVRPQAQPAAELWRQPQAAQEFTSWAPAAAPVPSPQAGGGGALAAPAPAPAAPQPVWGDGTRGRNGDCIPPAERRGYATMRAALASEARDLEEPLRHIAQLALAPRW
eukprot:TRINITY_DN35990_c0_g1_i1.p1 TRINITY_DN35990_c0_g1~~TRINITY_DN35990_c0_g1_i1.p1  ORF type:complete len:552 (+),score=142.84 TRINITY_DN35990_c0_g1_i1:91-1656(+)